MAGMPNSLRRLLRQLGETRARLAEAEQALDAIRHGEVDGVVTSGPEGEHIFVRRGVREPYRVLIERLAEGALVLSREGCILFGNQAVVRLFRTRRVPVGDNLARFVREPDRPVLSDLLRRGWRRHSHGEVMARAEDGALVPLRLSLGRLNLGPESLLCAVASDLTETRRREEELRRMHAELERRVEERTAELAASRLEAVRMMEEAVEARRVAEAANRQLEEAMAARRRAQAEVEELNRTLERRVQERTAELRAANEELDAFVYAVSHDLRGPLRAMSGFSQALVEDLGGTLPEEAREYLGHIGEGSRKMGEIVDGLLKLSRSARGEWQRETVDLSALATRTLERLQSTEPGRSLRWTVAPDLVGDGDPRLLEIVMANLLGNAWKYTSRTPEATIRVFGEAAPDEVRVHVADNGAGFDMKYAGKLFQPFQRLHREDEFPGIGIGLATVHRIVRRHGGRLEATGRPGVGATFSFSLPKLDRSRRVNT